MTSASPVHPGAEWPLLGASHLRSKLTAIVVVAALLRLTFFAGTGLQDDTFYVSHAYHLSVGEFGVLGGARSGRLGFVLPPALAFAVFGVSEPAAVYMSFACSVAAPLVAFALGRFLFSVSVGLLAAVFLAVFPLELIFATQLYDCTVKTLLTGLALLAFLKGEETNRWAYHFAAGVSLGLAAFAHESALICLVFYPLYALFIRPPTRAHAIVGLGVLVGLSSDPLGYLLLTGDPLAHWHLLSQTVLARGFHDATEVGGNIGWLTQPLLRLLTEQEFGLFPYFYLPITAIALVRPAHPNQRVLALWVSSILLWTYYGPVSPLHYVTLPRHPRYLSSVTIPALVLLASWLLQRRRRGVVLAAVAALCVTSVLCAAVDNSRARSRPYRALHEYLVQYPPEALAVDRQGFFAVMLFEGFEPPFPVYELTGPWDGIEEITLEPRNDSAAALLQHLPERIEVATEREPVAESLRTAGAEVVESFAPPATVYGRLLSNPVIVRLLSLGREEYRMNVLREGPQPLRLYRVAPGRLEAGREDRDDPSPGQ